MRPHLWMMTVLLFGLFPPRAHAEQSWTIISPDGSLEVLLHFQTVGLSRELSYEIYRRSSKDRSRLLEASPLGISRGDQDLSTKLEFLSASPLRQISETYELTHGKCRRCHHQAAERTFHFVNSNGAKLDVVFRVADDGIAFRYIFPENDNAVRWVLKETTGFRVPKNAQAWIQPFDEPTQWTPAYENVYECAIAAGETSPTTAGWCMPALFELRDSADWLLITEVSEPGTYCGSRLQADAPQGLYRIRFPHTGEGNSEGQVEPQATLPWTMPWRVVLVGGLDTIVESTLVTDLSSAPIQSVSDWVKPGRVSWSWWSDHDSPQDYDKLCDFVDLAAEMGWEYSLVDANWTLMDGGNIRELAKYAAAKGVRLLVWYNSGGPHNSVAEKPRGCLGDPKVRRSEFELLREWGIAGIKVDFFQSDKQEMMQLYREILEDAVDYELIVNFHGCTLPRGWSKTYPNLMTMEAVRGAEFYTFSKGYPAQAVVQNTILPFTRNVVGPMDYTPVTFTRETAPHQTATIHELALSVVFESGLQHFADSASAYRHALPAIQLWMRDVPVAWEETRFLGGYPGEWVALARRKGERWYVGVINGKQSRTVRLDLAQLGMNGATVVLLRDAAKDKIVEVELQAANPVKIDLQPAGGAVLRVTR